MSSSEQITQYFAALDTLQSVSLHRIDEPVKELVLFHSLHASIYYAIWYGLYDTLVILCEKLQNYRFIDLVTAELDYVISDFCNEIIESIKSYADTLSASKTGPADASDSHAYTEAPINFTNERMRTRYSSFLEGLRIHI